MRSTGYFAFALVVGLAAGSPAFAANMCRAENLSCATTMPVGGYCECTSHGVTKDGTVAASARGRADNSTAGGCGAHPNAAGCR